MGEVLFVDRLTYEDTFAHRLICKRVFAHSLAFEYVFCWQVELGGVKSVESYKRSVCEDASWWSRVAYVSRARWASPEQEAIAAAPIIVPRYSKRFHFVS